MTREVHGPAGAYVERVEELHHRVDLVGEFRHREGRNLGIEGLEPGGATRQAPSREGLGVAARAAAATHPGHRGGVAMAGTQTRGAPAQTRGLDKQGLAAFLYRRDAAAVMLRRRALAVRLLGAAGFLGRGGPTVTARSFERVSSTRRAKFVRNNRTSRIDVDRSFEIATSDVAFGGCGDNRCSR